MVLSCAAKLTDFYQQAIFSHPLTVSLVSW